MIKLKRAYEIPAKEDGQRILVERLWPRGISKEKAEIAVWLKDIAPTTELRKWYNHEVNKWPEFRKKYKEELKQNSQAVQQIKELLKKPVTFIYAAKDTEHNSAVVLKEYLEEE
ncbi:MAG TPA: DUF488 domain-containing protein [Candidatus Saccharimonadales bacterium]|nr:DUF488 domain-containing protein [Candidatus Saccharimonadales bacterium]